MLGCHADELFLGLLEATQDAVIIVNDRENIEHANSHAESIFGYRRSDLTGAGLSLLLPPDSVSGRVLQGKIMAQIQTQNPDGSRRPFTARRKDGSVFPVEIRVSPLQNSSSGLVACFIRDITERASTERTIRELNVELETRVGERTNALRRANEKLQREIATRQRLETEILEISEREQQRIGRDLHDDLGQRLVGISYMCHLLSNNLLARGSPEADQALKITELLNNALALTRSLARGLHPVSMDSGGLVAALGDLADRTREIFRIKCRFFPPEDIPPLSDNAATHIYRIAQEAVTNAINHGGASMLKISLVSCPDKCVLAVEDNGSGMTARPNSRRKGMGLRIMQYRADVIGGTLGISTSSDRGATITCEIPLKS